MDIDVLPSANAEAFLASEASYEDILRYAGCISPMPTAVLNVLELLDDPQADAGALAAAISLDLRLTTALLQMAYPPASPPVGGPLTLPQAVTLVGRDALRCLARSMSLIGLAQPGALDQLVWEHSLATASMARWLAEECAHPQPDELFLLGLLHCLGQFILLAHPPSRLAYAGVLRQIREFGADYVSAENREIGVSHNIISALAARRWKFPKEFCQILLHYPEPLAGPLTPATRKLGLVKLADQLAHAAAIGRPAGYPIRVDLIEELAGALQLKRPGNRGTVELIVMARNQIHAEAVRWGAFLQASGPPAGIANPASPFRPPAY